MCLDMGTKRTGVAISDKDMRFVQDFFSFNYGGIKSDIEFLLQKIKISSTSGLIIGIPFGHAKDSAEKIPLKKIGLTDQQLSS